MSIFDKYSVKGYNICKKFQIGLVILMAQMRIHSLKKIQMEVIFSQNSPQNRIWRPPLY